MTKAKIVIRENVLLQYSSIYTTGVIKLIITHWLFTHETACHVITRVLLYYLSLSGVIKLKFNHPYGGVIVELQRWVSCIVNTS